MKRLSISFSVILLAFLVLLGSGGFTVGKMICGGEECAVTQYSLGKAKDCCATESTPAETLSCCCELIDVSYSLDEFSVSEKVNVSAQEFPSFFTASSFTFHVPSALLHLSSLSDPSPPNPRACLYFIGSLLL